MEIAKPQDLDVQQSVLPPIEWKHTRPAPMPVDERRRGLPHQWVKVRNSSDRHTHIVFDRESQPVELQPNQTRDIDMTVDDIEYFRSLRVPGRFDTGGYPRPLGPLVFTDLPDPAPPQAEVQKQRK